MDSDQSPNPDQIIDQNGSASVGQNQTAMPPTSGKSSGAGLGSMLGALRGMGSAKKFKALGIVAVVLLVSVFVSGKIGGSSNGTILLALDSKDERYYSVEMKDGKAVIGGRISSEDTGSVNILADLNDSESSSQELVAVDKNTIVLKQYPDGSDEDEVEFVKVDLKTLAQTRLFNASSGAFGTYVVSEKILLVTSRNACFKVDLEGVSTRLGAGTCVVAGGQIRVEDDTNDSLRVTTVDSSGKVSSPVKIALSDVDGFSEDRSVVWGRDKDGAVLVFDAIKGTQMWKNGSDTKRVRILNASDDGKSLLVTIDETVDSDSKVDLAVVSDVDGSPLVRVLASAYQVGGVIAPDGKTVLGFTQDLEAETGTLLYFDKSLKTGKSVANNVTIKDIGVASNGLAVAVSDTEIYSGSFAAGLEQKVNGSFESVYESFFSVAGTESLLMNLSESGSDGENQIVYVPSALAIDGGSNSIVIASGDDYRYVVTNSALAREGSIIFATQSNDYLIINQRKLEKDAETTRLVEGNLSSYFQINGENITYFEETDSDRYTTYGLKGTDASKRTVIAEGYLIVEFPIGDPQEELENLTWKFSTEVAQIDDDLEACNANGDTVIKVGESAIVNVKITTENFMSYNWQRFCVQNSDKGTDVTTRYSSVIDAGKAMNVYLRCIDYDESTSSNIFSQSGTASAGESGPAGYIGTRSSGSYSTCEISDNAYHGGSYGNSSYSNGGAMEVSVSEYVDSGEEEYAD